MLPFLTLAIQLGSEIFTTLVWKSRYIFVYTFPKVVHVKAWPMRISPQTCFLNDEKQEVKIK